MAHTVVTTIPGMDPDEYDALHEEIQRESDLDDGLLVHVATSVEEGMHVFEVWESEEAYDQFVEEEFAEIAAENELPPVEPDARGPTHNLDTERAR